LQDDVKECLKIKDELVTNKIKIDKLKYKRKSLMKNQEELEAKRAKLTDDVKELEERIEAGRRGEEIDVDVAFPDLLGDDDSGMDNLLSTNTQDLLETIDLSVFD
jgi:predicted nuclease with TOPRIM domain